MQQARLGGDGQSQSTPNNQVTPTKLQNTQKPKLRYTITNKTTPHYKTPKEKAKTKDTPSLISI